jgi:hypothetical protein
MEGSFVTAQNSQMQIPISARIGRFEHIEAPIQIAFPRVSTDKRSMSQQHRRRAKRRRRKAYLQRKKASVRSARREPAKPREKKEPVVAE